MKSNKLKFKKLFPQFERYDYKHSVCVVLLFLSLFCTTAFFSVSVIRTMQSVKDLVQSLAYYFCEVLAVPHGITPTVLIIPNLGGNYNISFPFTFAQFKIQLSELGKTIISADNLFSYFGGVARVAVGGITAIGICVPLIVLAVIIARMALNKQNNDYNYQTMPLRVFKRLSKLVYIPVKVALKNFIKFVLQNAFYIKLMLFLWLFNLNILTVIIEVFAYIFYFAVSFDLFHIYTIVYKLILDLSVAIAVIPLWVYVIFAIFLFDNFRKKIAFMRLNHFEMYDRGFINSLPIVSMVCGTMGKKKTTMLTDMALSQAVMFRDKALAKLLENDLKFPHFPWINLENELKRAMRFHQIFNLATCKAFIHKKALRWIKNTCPKKCFDYDYKRYGLYYDNNLQTVNLWQVLETYSQLYFIYIMQSSLLVSNYSIRTDSLMTDLGNFPLWNNNFFKRDSKQIDSFSRHAHILDFDMLRLSKRILENNRNANAFEFGVVVITEGGKERGNMLDTKEMKKSGDETNQKNDGFNAWLKMVRHSATIDNFPFVKVLIDEQRPMSMGADIRELCEIVHIQEASDRKLAMPFFFGESLLYDFVRSKFDCFYTDYRYNRADNTLLLHTVKTAVSKIHNYFIRTNNLFSFCELDLTTERGSMDGNQDSRKYFLCEKKVFSKRFSTDCFSDYFMEKSLLSTVGLTDLTEYETERATLNELNNQNSYFINDLMGKKQRKDVNY